MKIIPVIFLSLGLAAPAISHAGLYTDDLARCLVESTSPQDRSDLVRWIFSAAAAHPVVKPIASVGPREMDAANRAAGSLLMRLLTVSCRTPAQKALKYEGNSALEASFKVLGEVAGQELFSSPEVTQAMDGFANYLDADKLKALVKPD